MSAAGQAEAQAEVQAEVQAEAPGTESGAEPALGRASRVVPFAAGLATIVVLVALALVPFLTPLWIFPGQARAEADAWTGWPIEVVHDVTGAVLADLVLGPPDFDQSVDGVPVFNDREKGHLRDVRTVLVAFALATAVAAALLATAWWLARGSTAAWRGIRTGAKVLAVAVVALGILSIVAFDTVFELFHRLLFPGGSYAFDPSNERLVQLFPEVFWYQTAIAIGVVIVGLALATWALAAWRIRRIDGARTAGSDGAGGAR